MVERLIFYIERHLTLFLGQICLNKTDKEISNFSPKPWTSPFGKIPILWVFEPMFSLSRQACLLYKTSKIVFSQFIFMIYYKGIPGVRRGYRGWQGVTKGDRGLEGVTGGLQGVTRGYKGLQGVTKGDSSYMGWQKVTKDVRNFFLTGRFPDTFCWSILHKNQSSRNLKFLTKMMD